VGRNDGWVFFVGGGWVVCKREIDGWVGMGFLRDLGWVEREREGEGGRGRGVKVRWLGGVFCA